MRISDCSSDVGASDRVVVARAAGVSVWQCLLPAIGIALTLGVIHITIFNPVASVLLLKFEQLESRYLDRSTSMLAVSKNGLWLRQADDRGQSVIHALSVSNTDMVLNDVIIFLYERSEERRVGKGGVSTSRSRWSPSH